jgi:hypothetical protein
MEPFFYNDNFYTELEDLCSYEEWDKEEIQSWPDDFKLEADCCDLETIEEIDAEWIASRIDDERFSEESYDKEYAKILKVLNENIDFDKINSLLPKLYYSNRSKLYFTKADLLEACS